MTNCCLTPTEPFSASISWREHVKHVVFRWDKDDICAVLDNCSLLLLLNVVCSEAAYVNFRSFWFDPTRGSNLQSMTIEACTPTITPPMLFSAVFDRLNNIQSWVSYTFQNITYDDQKFLLSLSNLSDSFSPFVKAFTIVQEACFI